MSAALRPVLWSAPSIENPGKEVFVVETDAAKGLIRTYEGEVGDLAPLSVELDAARALEKAKLVLRGEPEALGDARVLTALATVLVSLYERGLDPACEIAVPKRKETQI